MLTGPAEHDLEKLIRMLPSNDPLRNETAQETVQLRGFLRELNQLDSSGDAGRYGRHLQGRGECLESWCHIESEGLLVHADLIYNFFGPNKGHRKRDVDA